MEKKKRVSKDKAPMVASLVDGSTRVGISAPSTVTEQDLAPMQEGSKYMMAKTWMSEKQVLRLVQKTPRHYVHTRKGKGGQVWDYVPGWYVQKVLNYVFGWAWDFEVTSHGREGDMVWVLGRLTVKDDHGHTITKTQFGRSEIKFLKGTKTPLDYGNDLKGATTDALKKCASLLGIASDIYGKSEQRELGVPVPIFTPGQPKPAEPVVAQPTQWQPVIEAECHGCGEPITKEIAKISKHLYSRPLCKNCQALESRAKR